MAQPTREELKLLMQCAARLTLALEKIAAAADAFARPLREQQKKSEARSKAIRDAREDAVAAGLDRFTGPDGRVHRIRRRSNRGATFSTGSDL